MACKSITVQRVEKRKYSKDRSVILDPLEATHPEAEETWTNLMQLMTSLQLLLLLLSALGRIEVFGYHSYDFGVRSHKYARTPIDHKDDVCQEQTVITRWINEQVVRNAKITRFNQRLRELLDALNGNKTAKNEEKFCCFYEKETMEQLFKDITILSKKYKIDEGAPFNTTGDMGQDLDLILNRFKKVVNVDVNSCCKHLAENLKELEKDFEKQLKDLKQNFNEKNDVKKKKDTDLHDKQMELDNKIDQLKTRIEKLEENQKNNNEKQLQSDKCCKNLETKINELKQELDKAKTEAKDKTTALENELKDLQVKQKEQEDKINEINEELKKRAENMKKVMENCEKNCGNEAIEKEKSKDKANSQRLDSLEQSIRNLTDNHKKLNDLNENLAKCQKLENNLKTTEEKVNKLQENEDEKKKYQDKQIEDQTKLQQEIENAKTCCKNSDNLAKDNQDLHEKIKHMNESYTDHISKLDGDIKDLKNRLNEALEKIKQENDDDNKNNFNFDDKLKELNKNIEALRITLNDNHDKLIKLKNESAKDFEELKPLIDDQKTAAQEFNKEVEKRFEDLKAQNNNNKPTGIEDRLNRLEKQQDQMSENIEKALQLEKRTADLEKQLKEALESLSLSQSEMEKCSTRCHFLDDIDNLVDRIEDLETKAQKCDKPDTNKQNENKPNTSNSNAHKPNKNTHKNKDKNKGKEAAVGGIDFEL